MLDTVDEAIAKTEAVIAKLKQVRAGMLHDLLTRGLDEHGQLRDPVAHPEQFQDSPLGLIPKDWEVRTGGGMKRTSNTASHSMNVCSLKSKLDQRFSCQEISTAMVDFISQMRIPSISVESFLLKRF